MPDWLQNTVAHSPIEPGTMAVRIALAVVAGVIIAAIYRLSHGRRARDSATLTATLVLLTALLAMVSMVIGDSVARAFGLVGALSIVRFRTVVEDTRDTAFVIFAVIAGMAIGTGLLMVAAVGIPIVGVAALLLHTVDSAKSPAPRPAELPRTLTVRLSLGRDTAPIVAAIYKAPGGTLLSTRGVRTARQGTAIEISYSVIIPDDGAAALVLALNALEGVQEVDLAPAADGPVSTAAV